MSENKVSFNLKNVHYAKITMNEGVPSFATPVAVPGAITLTLDAVGDTQKLYADGTVYYTSIANNGYEGELELAKVPDAMMTDIWGMTLSTDKVLVETNDVEPAEFALLYQVDGDVNSDYFLMYRCVGTRPAVGSSTNTDSKEPQTQTVKLTCMPIVSTGELDGRVKARTTATTTETVKSGWFSNVWVG